MARSYRSRASIVVRSAIGSRRRWPFACCSIVTTTRRRGSIDRRFRSHSDGACSINLPARDLSRAIHREAPVRTPGSPRLSPHERHRNASPRRPLVAPASSPGQWIRDRAFRHFRGLLLRLDSTGAVRESFACKGMSPAGQPEAGLCVSFCVSLGRMGNA